ncbi:hypothetical protein [Streptosporangium sp. LJ11]|uniref:hypothetical protein n=1 Tax=Streptosporangium sp. LJ11 TaxID=3436927 RepID=UPI003F7A2AD1
MGEDLTCGRELRRGRCGPGEVIGPGTLQPGQDEQSLHLAGVGAPGAAPTELDDTRVMQHADALKKGRWISATEQIRGPLFVPVNRRGTAQPRHLTPDAVADALNVRRPAAALPPLTPHDLRRTFAGGRQVASRSPPDHLSGGVYACTGAPVEQADNRISLWTV